MSENNLKSFKMYGEISTDMLKEFDVYLSRTRAQRESVIEICSGGGDIFAGIGIADKIMSSGRKFTAHVIGYAASAAATIACACDRVTASKNSTFMMHSVRDDKTHLVDEGSHVANARQIAIIGRKMPGITEKDLMTDRWMTAEEARDGGIVDSIVDIAPTEEQARWCASIRYGVKNGGCDMSKKVAKRAEENLDEKIIVEEEEKETADEGLDEKIVVEEEEKETADDTEIIVRMTEAIEALSARLAALEDRITALEAGGAVIEEKVEETVETACARRLAAVTQKIAAVTKPAARKSLTGISKKESGIIEKRDLERYKAQYGSKFNRYINE